MKISVLTPTYNRAELLTRLYQSLVENMGKGIQIQWLVMDDGSTDQTEQILAKMKEENKIEIYYQKQENQGKMKALNNLLPQVTGEVMIECDSDDYFKANAFEIIAEYAKQMEEKTYALAFLKEDQNGNNLGNLFEKEKTTMFDLYFKDAEPAEGEKVLVFKTSIRKQYRYPLEKNEKFVTEARLYHQMDLHYHIIGVNESIMVCEYQKDGYTNNILEVFKNNPYGYYEYFKEMFLMDWNGVYLQKRLYILKHYILFSVLTGKNIKTIIQNVKGIVNKIAVIILYLPGKWATKRRFK